MVLYKGIRCHSSHGLCTGYLGYPFQYMCADDELHPYLFLFIHLTGKLFHIALYPLIFERISQVVSTEEDHKVRHPIIPFTPYATSIGFPFLTLLKSVMF